MRLDVYNHVFPSRFIERIETTANKSALARMPSFRVCTTSTRPRLLEQFDDYQQVLSLSGSPIEFFAGAESSPDLARLANDGMAAPRSTTATPGECSASSSAQGPAP